MQLLLAIPLVARLGIVFLVAACAASLANATIYQFAWHLRLRSPWQRRHDDVARRTWPDYLPILGWLRLRRESKVHGTAHWVRPLLVELLFALGMAWLYWWETVALGLIAEQLAVVPGGVNTTVLVGPAHLQFLAHAILAWFMLIATFIDADDQIIPDIVTVPGTLIGLIFVTFFPLALLPQITMPAIAPQVGVHLIDRAGNATQFYLEPVHLAASSDWPAALVAAPNLESLAIGLACYWLWCFAFVRRRWITRRGMGRAVRYFLARIARDWWSTPLREVTAIGTLAVLGVWWWGGPAWVGLLTGLVGLVGSGGIVWLVRIFAGAALGKEAMGFGDVLLMMMVGTFIGWQAGVIVFFLAPFAALVYGLIQLIARRENVLPYGPFLCAATLFVIARWDMVWLKVEPLFQLPWLVPAVLLICMVLIGAILTVWRVLKDLIWPLPEAE